LDKFIWDGVVNEIILYLLLNPIYTRNSYDKGDIKNSKELKAENFKDVKIYTTPFQINR